MSDSGMQPMTLERVCAIVAKAYEQTPDDREWLLDELHAQLRELHRAERSDAPSAVDSRSPAPGETPYTKEELDALGDAIAECDAIANSSDYTPQGRHEATQQRDRLFYQARYRLLATAKAGLLGYVENADDVQHRLARERKRRTSSGQASPKSVLTPGEPA